MNSIKKFLSTIDPFSHLPEQELTGLAASAKTLDHSKGENIFTEGQSAASMWILMTGRLEIFKYNSDGKPQAIESIYPRDIFGTLCRLGGGKSQYPCTAIATVASSSIRIPDDRFTAVFNRYPAVMNGVCLLCSKRLNMMQQLTSSYQEPVEKRIVKTLLQLSKTHGNTLLFTKRQISEFAATTVETTIRTLSAFQKKKIITSSRGKIVLKDSVRLHSLLN